MKKKIVFLTGSGISAESGIPTFRDAGEGLWENFDVKQICTREAINLNTTFVNEFYNMLRSKWKDCKPNEGHKLITSLQDRYDVQVITQNVDSLHEQAGTEKVLHLHGEIMKCCSLKNPEDESCWVNLPQPGFGESGLEIPADYEAADGSALRPYIVFFGEPVPNMMKAIPLIQEADIVVVIGTSLVVYPAAGLLGYVSFPKSIYIIDPGTPELPESSAFITHIQEKASTGMKTLIEKYLTDGSN